MKKLFLSLVAAIVAATATYAQSDLVATLSHDGVTTAYYGPDALKNAHTTAVHGDVITLSAGTFNAVTINKAVTIRGAGMKENTESATFSTFITGTFTISGGSGNTDYHLSIEGVYINDDVTIGNLKNASFQKCRFAKVLPSGSYSMVNLSFVNCLITSYFAITSGDYVSCKNCYVKNAVCIDSSSSFEFTNCVVCNDGESYKYWINSGYSTTVNATVYAITYSSFYNSIIYGNSLSGNAYATYNIISSSSTASHCIGKSRTNSNVFTNFPNSINTNITDDLSTIFEDYTGTYTEDVTFTLTDNAKSKYKGLDGTEVGIYGGDVPFDPTPSNPQITQFDVEKNTANGKLTVKINVE